MKKRILLFIFILLLLACQNNKSSNSSDLVSNNLNNGNIVEKTNESNENSVAKKLVAPEKNPRLALEQLGFWNKQYYQLEYNPIYGYCYQHLFPSMDTSQEKNVISFHVKSLSIEPMVIFVVDKVAYKHNTYELLGTINDETYTVYLKVQDGKTINIQLLEFDINESYDLLSGIAYSSFINTYNKQESPIFDLSVYDTCEEQDIAIISDISDKLTDDSVKEQHGIDIKTDKGLDCWGKWANINDKAHVYYELDKKNLLFKDYSEQIFSGGALLTNVIDNIAYKNGMFYFNSEDSELIGYICIPIDNNTSMWVLDDVNLGIFEKYKEH